VSVSSAERKGNCAILTPSFLSSQSQWKCTRGGGERASKGIFRGTHTIMQRKNIISLSAQKEVETRLQKVQARIVAFLFLFHMIYVCRAIEATLFLYSILFDDSPIKDFSIKFNKPFFKYMLIVHSSKSRTNL